jgi:hypothetical protein
MAHPVAKTIAFHRAATIDLTGIASMVVHFAPLALLSACSMRWF